MKRVLMIVLVIFALFGVASVSAQSVPCLGGLSEEQCVTFQTAATNFIAAESFNVEFVNFAGGYNAATGFESDIIVSGTADYVLSPDGGVSSIQVLGNILGEQGASGDTTGAGQGFGLIFVDGTLYMGSGPVNATVDQLVWDSLAVGDDYRLVLTGALDAVSVLQQYDATWAEDTRFGSDPNYVYFSAQQNTTMTPGDVIDPLSMSDSAEFTLLALLGGGALSAPVEGETLIDGVISLDVANSQVYGLAQINLANYDISGQSVMQLAGSQVLFRSINQPVEVTAPANSVPMGAMLTPLVSNFNSLGALGLVNTGYLPFFLPTIAVGSTLPEGVQDPSEFTDFILSLVGSTPTVAAQPPTGTTDLSGVLSGLIGGAGSSGTGTPDAEALTAMIMGMMGGAEGLEGVDQEALTALIAAMMSGDASSLDAETMSALMQAFGGTSGGNVDPEALTAMIMGMMGGAQGMEGVDQEALMGMIQGMMGGSGSSGTGGIDLGGLLGAVGSTGGTGSTGSTGGIDLGGLLGAVGSTGSTGSTASGPTGGGAIEFGQTVSGTLNNSTDQWTFSGTSGQTVTIDLQGDFDTYLELLDANGTQLITDDDGGDLFNSLISGYSLPSAGEYTIVARAFGGPGTGNYTLLLSSGTVGAATGSTGSTGTTTTPGTISSLFGNGSSTSTTTTGPTGGSAIEYGQTITGELATGAADEYTFTASENDIVTIAMNSAEFDTYLELNSASGDQFTFNDDFNGLNSQIGPIPLQAGTYTIVARSFGSSGAGEYELSLELSTGDTAINTIEIGQTVDGSLMGSPQFWTFEGTAGGRVTIAMSSDDFDTYLELIGPDGIQVAFNDDFDGLNSQITTRLPGTGTYTIIARGFSSAPSGDYTLSLE